ncbi:MAG: molybdenum cofactor biosynthesis protein MoaE [Planctomycetes bacterium]|nr:molybdenum cofactor biosynthesis protein MoaE [Planctomycetota bacterium]
MTSSRCELRFTSACIALEPLLEEVRSDGDGAVVSFLGVVRDHARGKRVRFLDYEAYPPMAEVQMRLLFEEARERFGLERALVVHRTGRLQIGEASVAIAVATPHRAAGFEACRHLIDRLKETVPIWKKETYEDGSAWIGERS